MGAQPESLLLRYCSWGAESDLFLSLSLVSTLVGTAAAVFTLPLASWQVTFKLAVEIFLEMKNGGGPSREKNA